MDIEIKLTESFKKELKKLKKNYKSISKDIDTLILILEKNPKYGTDLGNDFYKIRIKNSDNNKGKSGGYRVITYYNNGEYLIFVSIYSKSESDNISDKRLFSIINQYFTSL